MISNVHGIRFALLITALLVLSACERPPVESDQLGFRGTGMQQVTNPRLRGLESMIPDPLPPAPAAGPKASEVYENLELLGDVPLPQFVRLMQALTSWVAPQEGCAYCHAPGESMASDSLYTKVVSRRMLAMTREINNNWTSHVGNTGVTCYTCHRGNNVPEYGWYQAADESARLPMLGHDAGQNRAAPQIGLTSLPYDPFSKYLVDPESIRVIGEKPLPGKTPGASIQATEGTYALMMHLSQSLGVNCTYCHNSRAFAVWEESSPQRTTAWHGLSLVPALNTGYLASIKEILPDDRLGPHGDVQKVNCMTCHQGASKPLNGVSMLADYPLLATAQP